MAGERDAECNSACGTTTCVLASQFPSHTIDLILQNLPLAGYAFTRRVRALPLTPISLLETGLTFLCLGRKPGRLFGL
jgi:hypothetical protein